MKNVIKLIAVVAMFAFVGCSDSSTENLANGPLKGKVFGEVFNATGGKSFLSGGKLSIHITNVSADCSSNVLDYVLSISTDVDNKVGTTTNANVVFNKKNEPPLNVLNSEVTVESLTSSEVKVKIKSTSTSNNTLEGTFTVPFCN